MEGSRDQGSKGARDQGIRGARDQGIEGARDQGGEGTGEGEAGGSGWANYVKLGLPVIASSDGHFLAEIGRARTILEMEAATFEELALALRRVGGRQVRPVLGGEVELGGQVEPRREGGPRPIGNDGG